MSKQENQITITLDKEQIKFIKSFLPLDSPYCSSCKYYCESMCGQCKDERCYLDEIIEKIGGEDDE